MNPKFEKTNIRGSNKIPLILLDKFTISCNKCHKLAKFKYVTNGSCGDPECCGEISYDLWIECKNCNKRETIGKFTDNTDGYWDTNWDNEV